MRVSVFRLAVVGTVVFGCAILAGGAAQTGHRLANGVNLAYVEQGKGTPVVFAHGAVGDLRFWEPQHQEIARRHRFIAYTYRYHGVDPWPDDGKQYSATTHAADLADLLAGLKAGPVHLVGLSYGGLIAALVALDRPQLVRSLTLAEPGIFSLLAEIPEAKPALDAWNKGAEPMVAALQAGDSLGATKHLVALVTNQGPGSFDALPGAFRQILIDNARTLPLLFAAPPPAISCDMLRKVKIPTLVVGGAETPSFFSEVNKAVVRCIAGSRLQVIPKAGHAMSFDNPADFNRTLLQFLARH